MEGILVVQVRTAVNCTVLLDKYLVASMRGSDLYRHEKLYTVLFCYIYIYLVAGSRGSGLYRHGHLYIVLYCNIFI